MTPTELRAAMQDAGISVRRFAAILRVSFPTVQAWRDGRSKPGTWAMERLIRSELRRLTKRRIRASIRSPEVGIVEPGASCEAPPVVLEPETAPEVES